MEESDELKHFTHEALIRITSSFKTYSKKRLNEFGNIKATFKYNIEDVANAHEIVRNATEYGNELASARNIGLFLSRELLKHEELLDASIVKFENSENINQLNSEINVVKNTIGNVALSHDSIENIRATEKIIMLKKSGVLDFLKEQQPFSSSTKALADFISMLTGENGGALRSYLNPMYSPNDDIDQKNNPMIREKVVQKVISKMNNIGYFPPK